MDVIRRIGTFIMHLTLEGIWLNVQKVEHLQLQIDLTKILQTHF